MEAAVRSYLSITKNMFQTAIAWRFHFFMMAFSNIVYLIFLYFLWDAIFESSGSDRLNGMSFEQVFVYMALVSSVVVLFKTYSEWEMSNRIIDGNIIMDLIKPLDLQSMNFFRSIGIVLFNLVTITLPVMLIVYAKWGDQLNGGAALGWFALSAVLAYGISYLFDFIVGVIAFYTESIWGISIAKETVILFFAGAVVPLQFFPEGMQTVLAWLPFQAIYHTPLQILTNLELSRAALLQSVGVQAIWVVVLLVASRLFYNRSLKTVTVNGG